MQFFYSKTQQNSIDEQAKKTDFSGIRQGSGAVMLQFLWNIRNRRNAAAGSASTPDDAAMPADLLSHPAIRKMSAAELADLPFPRHAAAVVHAAEPTSGRRKG